MDCGRRLRVGRDSTREWRVYGGWRGELVYVMRRLVGAPGIVLAVVVSIGIGIAANATIFAMVSRFVLRRRRWVIRRRW